MVLSGHGLAIEWRRWTERGKKILPQQCRAYIKDPAHAIWSVRMLTYGSLIAYP
jgi:hypothetical protein